MLVVRYDLYEREPWPMLAIACALGAAAGEGLGHVMDHTVVWFAGPDPGPIALAAVAASHEEAVRFLVVGGLAFVAGFQLNDPIDGLVYGSIVGLGMALEEARWVLILDPPRDGILPGAELVRLAGHLVLGGITGFPIGSLRTPRMRFRSAASICLAISITIHFLWDWISFDAVARGAQGPAHTASVIVLMLCGMGVFGALVVRGSEYSREIFAPDSRLRVWRRG